MTAQFQAAVDKLLGRLDHPENGGDNDPELSRQMFDDGSRVVQIIMIRSNQTSYRLNLDGPGEVSFDGCEWIPLGS